MDCYTANWNPLGDSAFYRKYELYSMAWDLKEELRDCLVAAAPYGGPIGLYYMGNVWGAGQKISSRTTALLRSPWRKEKAASARPVLRIYSASGVLLASLPWKSGPVVSLGWSAEEELLCVQEDGAVLVYGLHGDFRRHFSMGNEVLQNRVLDARIFHTEFGSGVAILTGAHRFTLSANVGDLKLRRMPEVPGLQAAPSCWTTLCQERVAHILLAVGPDLYLLDHAACSTVTPPGLAPGVSSFLQMAVSFTYRHLALFTDTGYIWMGTASLKEKLCEFNCSIRTPPKQMVWCSRPRSKERAVVVAWERRLMVVGDAPESIQFVLDEDSYLVSELDGVRIVSHSTHEFLHEVPVASEEIFKIASMAPGALLLEAQKEYEKESQKADEYLREIQELGQLTQAVQQCIEAAGHEHRPDMQKSLLRAASFGKCFLDRFPPDSFVRMCQDLRVLNAVRDYHIGIPLTYSQYKQLTIQGRLVKSISPDFFSGEDVEDVWATEDQMRLLRLQRRLEDELGDQFLDLSLHDTVTTLILGGHNKRAEQLARDFRIPDKRLWWLKLTALAELEDWEELEKFSKSKKSPIGYLPFVEICMKQQNKYEAKKYASRVGPEQKVKALLLVGDVAQAADVAIEHRNEAELSLVLSHCTGTTDGPTVDKIQRARAQAQKK
nr:vacuolar protein sorting-associated protein 16 homolog [Manis javanica]